MSLALVVALLGCNHSPKEQSPEKKAPSTSAPTTPSAPVGEATSDVSFSPEKYRQSSTSPPPRPFLGPEARLVEGGIRVRILKQGSGKLPPKDGALIFLDRTTWVGQETIPAGTTTERTAPLAVPSESLPLPYQQQLARIPAGSQVAIGLPKGGARPFGGSQEEELLMLITIFDYQPLPKSKTKPRAPQDRHLHADEPAAVPPTEAAKESPGISLVINAPGPGAEVRRQSQVVLLADVWQNRQGVLDPMIKGRRLSIQISDYPALGTIVVGRREGTLLTVWAKAKSLRSFIPDLADGDYVLRVSVARVAPN